MYDSPNEPAAKVIVGCAFGAFVGIALFSYGVAALVNQKRLDERGLTIAARVTEARHMLEIGEGTHDSFEVRYAFEVPGHPGTFTATDEFHRSNLWVTTDGRAEWEGAQATGQVQVRYLPDNPRFNRLVTHHGLPIFDCATVIVLGLALLLPCLRIGWLEATGQGGYWRAVLARIRSPHHP